MNTRPSIASMALAVLLTACGGSGDSSSTCSLSNTAGCGGSLPPANQAANTAPAGLPDKAASEGLGELRRGQRADSP